MSIFAYLDAGTGSLIVQAIIGAVVGIGVVLRTFWGRITGIFRRDEQTPEQKPKKAKKSKSTE